MLHMTRGEYNRETEAGEVGEDKDDGEKITWLLWEAQAHSC